ncbi:Rgp1-domain-containing protein [Chytriomyces cf. hyalinus JEL632]|nr:Rgp1-domain-containing protein [Chytriomyces cf. hyalinus JEL632]
MQVHVVPTQTSFFSGDTYSASIQFTHTSTSNAPQRIMWAFAQIVAVAALDRGLIAVGDSEQRRVRRTTSSLMVGGGFGGFAVAEIAGLMGADYSRTEKTFPIFATAPAILFSDLSLDANLSRTFSFSIQLPQGLPPSHRGKAAKIIYKFVICVQPFGASKSQMFYTPIRMFAAVGDLLSKRVFDVLAPVVLTKDTSVVQEIFESENEFDCLLDSRVSSIVAEDEDEDMSLTQRLIMLCQMSGKVMFDICKQDDVVANLVLIRSAYRLGETIAGVLDFSKSSLPCFQVSAFLEITETVDANYAVQTNSSASPTPKKAIKRILAEQHACTLNTCRMGIALPIPNSATPDFVTSAVSLSYSIRFEFITSRNTAGDAKLMETVQTRPLTAEDVTAAINASSPSATTATANAQTTAIAQSDFEMVGEYEGAPAFVTARTVSRVNVEAFECVLAVRVYPNGASLSAGGVGGVSGSARVFDVDF